MKKTYLLDGLDCANCAAKIEKAVAGIEGVTSVTVNFLTTKMVLEAAESNILEIEKKAVKLIHKYEPEVEVVSA